ncbi:MAG: hypothetical protein V4723_22290 [Pseudomonadota bacterium]
MNLFREILLQNLRDSYTSMAKLALYPIKKQVETCLARAIPGFLKQTLPWRQRHFCSEFT